MEQSSNLFFKMIINMNEKQDRENRELEIYDAFLMVFCI